MSASKSTRREFLRTSAVVAAASSFAVPALARTKSPNDKLNIACVGVAGRAAADVGAVAGENIVAICDVDDNNLARATKADPKAKREALVAEHHHAKKYNDFRKMLSELENEIDAVVVGTPDHTHAPSAVMAMRMGKHCYCEKPLTHSVYESRVAAEVAKEKNLVTQMGTQIHATNNYRRVVELIQSGTIGPVEEVHVWCGKGWGGTGTRPTETPPVPKNLHWDLWLGPAPYRPYHPCYVPANWRRWWDFGNGTLGDMACHYMDLPFWALELRHPTTIEAQGPPVNPEMCPLELSVRYEFPARAGLPACKLTWYDGAKRPALLAEKKLPAWGAGVLFVGKDGMCMANYGGYKLFPEEKFADFKPPEQTIPNSIGHHAEWINACKTGGPTTCNFNYSGALSEAVLLGTVAYRTGKKLEWDAANLKATNCPEADQYVRREYRKGWTL